MSDVILINPNGSPIALPPGASLGERLQQALTGQQGAREVTINVAVRGTAPVVGLGEWLTEQERRS